MANDSSTGGPLVPYRDSYLAVPLEGDALTDFFHDIFVGVTSIANDLVRPRWQPEPPNLPAISVDWMAFAVTKGPQDVNAVAYHETPRLDETPRSLDHINPVTGQPDNLDPESFDIIMRNEQLIIPCSLYGPNADLNAAVLRDAFAVSQNREALQIQGMGFVESDYPLSVPTIINEKWYARVDITLYFRRQIRRVYPVYDIIEVPGTVDADTVERAINVTSNE